MLSCYSAICFVASSVVLYFALCDGIFMGTRFMGEREVCIWMPYFSPTSVVIVVVVVVFASKFCVWFAVVGYDDCNFHKNICVLLEEANSFFPFPPLTDCL